MTKAAEEEHAFLYVDAGSHGLFPERLRTHHGVEMARRAVPGHVRPSFKELEQGLPHRRRGRSCHRLLIWLCCKEPTRTQLWTKLAPSSSSREKRPRRPPRRRVEKSPYADFVTAMMASLSSWLLNSANKCRKPSADISKTPPAPRKKVGSNMVGAGENFILTRDNMPKLKDQLQQAMKQMTDFEKLKNHIEMTVTTEGLRIETL